MTTLSPPALDRPEQPAHSVWDVIAAHPTLAGMTRPEPRSCEPLPYCADHTALAVWDEITGPHVTSITVAATYPEWTVIHREGGTVSFGPTIIGGSGGGTITIIETLGPIISDPKPAPDIAPIPLPAAGLLLVAALILIPILKRRPT